ncbi:hypothetical protein B0T11DRAFT_330612 [Plectosphaerella cucumerina]|uniref:Uncharacterized protein n=1 Tax=Plectosphaerella cucumerina TaxID=40658 RepID=A0A8K0X242_9PEZI|nr:hypothetical protein B0T11DRAFT_330612 [Plectosphaerella cucumerina]
MSSGWNNLPQEIRWMIVDYIRDIIHPWSTDDPPCPALPLVCREWHRYFAHENFRILVLDQYRLNMFRELVDNSRIKHVERIVLRVQLLSYDCSVCEEPEDGKTARANTIMFLNTLRELTTIMSSFDASCHPGITLDLGAFSPSDGEHSFRECRFSRDYRYGAAQHVYKHHSQEVLAQKRTQAVLSSSGCPGWKRVCDLTNPSRSEGSERRTYATIGDRCNCPDCWSFYVLQFEPVPIISALVLRRHYHRHISPVYLAELIHKSLPKLQSFRHEVPLHASAEDASTFWEEYKVIFRAFPDTLNHLAIYQESEQVPRLEDNLDPSG